MAQPIPPCMCRDSRGPHVSLLQAFLCGAGFGSKLVFDQDYGPKTSWAVKAWQLANNTVIQDGNCDRGTLLKMQEWGDFDFEAACRTIRGVTIFVQPDGQRIPWSPEED